MNKFLLLKLYGVTLVVLAIIDIPWILLVAKNFYVQQIGHLMTETPLYWPAVLFYSLYAFGLVYFVIVPSMDHSLLSTFARGCFFGLVVYSGYDLTNQATLQGWPLLMTVVDMAWGSFLSGSVSVVTVVIASYF